MVRYENGAAIVPLPGGINLSATFDCGQAFRWRALPDGGYEGIAGGYRAAIRAVEAGISITPCSQAEYEGFWRFYLDIDHDYTADERALLADASMLPVVHCCSGMRILNQPMWECLLSFLLSSNNNVKRIASIIERLSACFGEDMGGYHAFPTPQALARAGEEAIFTCGAGYRAAYVYRSACAVAEGFDLERLRRMGYDAAKAELMTLHGVGSKVADCVLLFSCGHRCAFPVDVWVKRSVPLYFPEAGTTPKELLALADRHFGDRAGLAQQMIFHYERVCRAEENSPA